MTASTLVKWAGAHSGTPPAKLIPKLHSREDSLALCFHRRSHSFYANSLKINSIFHKSFDVVSLR